MSATEPPIFDGHNDVLSKLVRAGGRDALRGFREGRDGHLDLPRARAGGFAGGLFAIWAPSPGDWRAVEAMMEAPAYDVPLPDPVPRDEATAAAFAQAALLLELDRTGAVALCRSVADIRSAMAAGTMAAVMHLEGAEAIGPDLDALDVLHAAGLRSLGPVWSRPTIWGHGVPFRYPSKPDTGPGLTEDGLRLVRRCDELGVVIDLSHLNEAGFDDVARTSRNPLVATHSNVHALCPHARNLTDRQLDAIRDSDGMVGLNLAVSFLRADGRARGDVTPDVLLDHLDHLLDRLGEDRVGLGSDYDGATVPDFVADVAALPALRAAMRGQGYDEGLIAKLCHGNWLRVLGRVWGG